MISKGYLDLDELKVAIDSIKDQLHRLDHAGQEWLEAKSFKLGDILFNYEIANHGIIFSINQDNELVIVMYYLSNLIANNITIEPIKMSVKDRYLDNLKLISIEELGNALTQRKVFNLDSFNGDFDGDSI